MNYSDPLDQLIAYLRQHLPSDRAVSAEDIADLLWLITSMSGVESSETTASVEQVVPPPSEKPSAELEQEKASTEKQDTSQPDQVSSETESAPDTKANLYAEQGAHTDVSQTRGRPFRTPAGSALPNKLALGRALRPFKQRSELLMKDIFDEAATADQAAETGFLIPVLRPATERWLDVALVMDESPSMIIWQRTVRELHRLLLRHGAFRDVRLWSIQADETGCIPLYSGIGASANRDRLHKPRELIDPQGRRLILVVSDTVSSIWRSGEAYALLKEWGQQNLVTLVQVLPRELWKRTSLGYLADILLSPVPRVSNNRLLAYDHEDAPFGQERLEGIAIPVVTLEEDRLRQWASALVNGDALSIVGYVLEEEIPTPTEEEMKDIQHQPIVQRYRVFKSTASKEARKLAGLFAAAPLTLHTMRLIQSQLLPESQQVHLAEIFLSGLIQRKETNGLAPVDPEYTAYEFIDEARQLLGNDVPIPSTYRVLELLSPRVAEIFGRPDDFMAILADEENGIFQIGADTLPLAELPPSVLRRVGLTGLASYLEKPEGKSSEIFPEIVDLPAWLQDQPVISVDESNTGLIGGEVDLPAWLQPQEQKQDEERGDRADNETVTPADPVAIARFHITLTRTTRDAKPIWDLLSMLLEQLNTHSYSVNNEVQAEYRSAILETDDPLLHYSLGIIQQHRELHSSALLEFEQAQALLEAESDVLLPMVLVHQAMASCYIELKQPEDALHQLQLAKDIADDASIDPTIKHSFARPHSQGDLVWQMAEAYAADDDLPNAEKALREALKQLPYNQAIYTKLADVCFRQGKLDEALASLEDLADYHENRQDLDKAIGVLENALKLAPGSINIGGRLARLYIRRGYPDKGVDGLIRVSELQHREGQIKDAVASLQQAGEIRWMQSMHAETLEIYDRIVQIAPQDVEARQWRAIMYTLVARNDEAIAEKKEIVKLLAQRNDLDNAIAELHHIIGLNTEDVEAYFMLGDMLMRRGEYNQALSLYNRISKMENVETERIEALIAAAQRMLQNQQTGSS